MTTDPQLPASSESDNPENDEPQVFAVNRQGPETHFTRRGFLALTGAATAALAIVSTESTAAQGNACTLRTTYAGLRVRSGPGTSFAVVGALEANVDYPVLGKAADSSGKTWWQVNVAGVGPAWVITTFVKVSGNCAGVGAAAGQGKPTAAAPAAGAACTLRTSSDGLRLRSGPGADFLLIGEMQAGVNYNVLGKSTDGNGALWWQIDAPNVGHVWVIGTYVFTHGDCASVPVVPPPPKVTLTPGNTAPGQTGVNVTVNGETFTLPCGSPIPAGAVCTCNCVSVPAPCSCDGHQACACDQVCTCNTVCTCDGAGHYWHPN